MISLSVNHDDISETETHLDIDKFNDEVLLASPTPTTSQPQPSDFVEYFEDAAKKGDSVVAVFMSDHLSGTLGCALSVARQIKQKFSDFICTIIDSTLSCEPEKYSVLSAVSARDAGKSHDEIALAAKTSVLRSRIMFVPEDLNFLVGGGRLKAPAAFVANKLQIFPIISTVDGDATSIKKVRTKAKSLSKMFEIFAEDVSKSDFVRASIQYAGKKTDDLLTLKAKVEDYLGFEVPVASVSPVVSVHVGPSVGLAYECRRQIERKVNENTTQISFAL